MKKTRYTYVKEWNHGLAIDANTGEDRCGILRFTSRKDAEQFCSEYRAPSHCPQAFAEIVKRREIESQIKTRNKYGDKIKHWVEPELDYEPEFWYEEIY